MVGFLLSYATLDWLSYYASHQSELRGSFETELHDSSEVKLHGSLGTELRGSLAAWPFVLLGS